MLKASKLKFDHNALCLHISNVRLLSASSYLGTGLNAENVVAFADAWDDFSANLPQNSDALRNVFLTGFVAGINLDTYAPVEGFDLVWSRKYDEMRNFVLHV